MKKLLYVLITVAFGLTGMSNTLAGAPSVYDLYSCSGSFADGYTAHVDLVEPWEGVAFQAEDDGVDDPACKGKKDEGFACTRKGNLITSRINDATEFRDFDDFVDNFTLDLATSDGDPTNAVVHADIFDPGSCADPFSCNYDDVDQGLDEEFVDDTCYDSGFAGGASADGNGYFDDPAESCGDTFDNNGEGLFADGEHFSSNRPKGGNKPHKNWAMYVPLTATCQTLIAVAANAPAPTCNSAAIEVDAIADGGDVATAVVAGTVLFTPDSDCSPTLDCEDSTSDTVCTPAP